MESRKGRQWKEGRRIIDVSGVWRDGHCNWWWNYRPGNYPRHFRQKHTQHTQIHTPTHTSSCTHRLPTIPRYTLYLLCAYPIDQSIIIANSDNLDKLWISHFWIWWKIVQKYQYIFAFLLINEHRSTEMFYKTENRHRELFIFSPFVHIDRLS